MTLNLLMQSYQEKACETDWYKIATITGIFVGITSAIGIAYSIYNQEHYRRNGK